MGVEGAEDICDYTAIGPKLVFETPHTSRRDETRLTPTSKTVQFRRVG